MIISAKEFKELVEIINSFPSSWSKPIPPNAIWFVYFKKEGKEWNSRTMWPGENVVFDSLEVGDDPRDIIDVSWVELEEEVVAELRRLDDTTDGEVTAAFSLVHACGILRSDHKSWDDKFHGFGHPE